MQRPAQKHQQRSSRTQFAKTQSGRAQSGRSQSGQTQLQSPTQLQDGRTRLQMATQLQDPQRQTPASPSASPQRSVQRSVVRPFPRQRSLPLWLRLLMRLQRSSMVAAFILAGLTVIVYSGTVYTQQRWSQGYHKLQEADRQERQMQTAAEAMKDQLAKQAEKPTSGLVPQSPDMQIVVPIAAASSGKPNQSPVPQPAPTSNAAIGY